MKIDQLIYFIEVAKHQHVRKAANILNISPSALSHAIASLEGELLVRLFEKEGKNIVLTKEGHKLFEKAENLVTGFQNLKEELKTDSNEKHHYRIGAVHSISTQIVAPLWARLSKKFSNTSIDLLTLRSANVLEGIVARELDIGLLFSPVEHPNIQLNTIKEGELLLAVRKKHPILSKTKSTQLKTIDQYPAIMPKAFHSIEPCIKNPVFKKFNINPYPKLITDSYDVALQLMINSNYWCLVPDIILDLYPNTFEVVKPESGWDAKYKLALAWHKRQYIPQFYLALKTELMNII